MISFWVYFNILRKDSKGNYKVSGHAYYVIGYKLKKGVIYIEVLNPLLSGGNYIKQNIANCNSYNNLKKKMIKNQKSKLSNLINKKFQ